MIMPTEYANLMHTIQAVLDKVDALQAMVNAAIPVEGAASAMPNAETLDAIADMVDSLASREAAHLSEEYDIVKGRN